MVNSDLFRTTAGMLNDICKYPSKTIHWKIEVSGRVWREEASMRKSKFSEHQIIAILKAVEAGRTVRDVCREHEISEATYYQWKSKYGGMEAADIRRLRELEEENRRLKAMYAELSLEHRILKEVLTKKL